MDHAGLWIVTALFLGCLAVFVMRDLRRRTDGTRRDRSDSGGSLWIGDSDGGGDGGGGGGD